MRDDSQVWILIGRKLAGECTKIEAEQLEKILSANAILRSVYRTIIDYWQHRDTLHKMVLHIAFKKHLSRIQKQTWPHRFSTN